jgi:uncharacterized membrane protein YqaE (UPF0057 family)
VLVEACFVVFANAYWGNYLMSTTTKNETTADFIRILLAIILPPLGVFFEVGLGLHFWLNIVLTLFGYLPGIIHAVWIIARR